MNAPLLHTLLRTSMHCVGCSHPPAHTCPIKLAIARAACAPNFASIVLLTSVCPFACLRCALAQVPNVLNECAVLQRLNKDPSPFIVRMYGAFQVRLQQHATTCFLSCCMLHTSCAPLCAHELPHRVSCSMRAAPPCELQHETCPTV